MKISIKGLDKAEVLQALYNNSRPLGLGFLNPKALQDITIEECKEIIEKSIPNDLYFDYLNGRVMKIDIADDILDSWLYDRDNGKGKAEQVINELRQSKED